MFRQVLVATLIAGAYSALPAGAQDAPSASAPVTVNNTTTVEAPSAAAPASAPVTINNSVSAPAAAPAAVITKETVTRTTNNVTRVVTVPSDPAPVQETNWILISFIAGTAIIVTGGIITAVMSGKTRTTTTTKSVDRTIH